MFRRWIENSDWHIVRFAFVVVSGIQFNLVSLFLLYIYFQKLLMQHVCKNLFPKFLLWDNKFLLGKVLSYYLDRIQLILQRNAFGHWLIHALVHRFPRSVIWSILQKCIWSFLWLFEWQSNLQEYRELLSIWIVMPTICQSRVICQASCL